MDGILQIDLNRRIEGPDEPRAAVPTMIVRAATAGELERMPAHVTWFYMRGQPVVLWLFSQRLTLVPLRLPAGEVLLLQLRQ